MAEICYSESVLRLHGRIIAVPVALGMGLAMGIFTQIEPFRSNLPIYAIGLFTVLGLTSMYFARNANGLAPVLRVTADSVTFHSGGRVKVEWPDIKQVFCESASDMDENGALAPRVVIEARRKGHTGPTMQRYVLDYTYGMTARELSRRLTDHLMECGPDNTAIAAVQRQGRPRVSKTPDDIETVTSQAFGRRASDSAAASH